MLSVILDISHSASSSGMFIVVTAINCAEHKIVARAKLAVKNSFFIILFLVNN
jgi:hypothetical protein